MTTTTGATKVLITKAKIYKLWPILAFFLLTHTALAVPGDFDGDGTSDMSVAAINRTRNTTTWSTRLTNGAGVLNWSFPQYADALVSGRFYPGNSKYYPGLVKVTRTTEPLLWVVKNAAGQDVSFRYGNPGDTVNNLGDWNGDGVDDIHVVRYVSGAVHWYVGLSGGGGSDYTFGQSGDSVGLAKDSTGRVAAMVLLRPGDANDNYQLNWFIRNPNTTTFTNVKWGLTGDIPLIPHDLDGDGGLDFVVTRRTGSLQVAYIRFSNGGYTSLFLGFDSSVPQIGYYAGYAGFAWSQRDNGGAAIRNADGSLNVFNFGNASSAIIRADGSVVQPSESGSFGGTSGGSSSGGSSTGGGQPGTISCSSVTDIGGLSNILYKSSNLHGGRGRSFLDQDHRFGGVRKLLVAGSNGKVIGCFGLYACDQPFGCRYYQAMCGDATSNSVFAANAAQNGGTRVLVGTGTGMCFSFPANVSRYGSVRK